MEGVLEFFEESQPLVIILVENLLDLRLKIESADGAVCFLGGVYFGAIFVALGAAGDVLCRDIVRLHTEF